MARLVHFCFHTPSDPETVLDALLGSGRTAVVVAHRLAAVAPRADNIAVFRDGSLLLGHPRRLALLEGWGRGWHLGGWSQICRI